MNQPTPDTDLLSYLKQQIDSVVHQGDILIIVPPFYNIGFIALGPYLLQAIAKEHGYKVDVLHLDLLLANLIGIEDYIEIQESPSFWMLGERMFARSAYGLPALGEDSAQTNEHFHTISPTNKAQMYLNHGHAFDLEKYQKLEEQCYQFAQCAGAIIAGLDYTIAGVSLGFCNQINAAVAFINHIKHHAIKTTTIIGGSYCEGEKAEALFSLSDKIDYIFEGESELTFIEFIEHTLSKRPYPNRLIKPKKAVPLEKLPIANYQAYAHQVKTIMGEEYYEHKVKAVWYETNRGCWWAEKAKCTFCGITEIGFRQKSIAQIAQDLEKIKAQVPDKFLFFTDLIMSSGFPDKLLNYSADTDSYPVLGMQLKVGRTIEEVVKLHQINAKYILPGVEAFSTSLLKKMKKGTTGRQNIYFIRNAYCFGISTQYYLLWGFPGDTAKEYTSLLDMIPSLKHLQPPQLFDGAQISRDAPYFTNPEEYNIKALTYWKVYDMIFPKQANIQQLANYFVGDYESYSYENIHLMEAIQKEVADWKKNWATCKLNMMFFMGRYMIYDSRKVTKPEVVNHVVSEEEATKIMSYQRHQTGQSQVLDWALEHKLGLLMDGWYLPLVTATPELLLKLNEYSKVEEAVSVLK
ncbi:RiPP maturation radical SAM C-methyltransferase [uncultured Microscilla sp.]|uniref:RiPP maturation radical SAM C-methyltransferase n=1 Tax=uncultured Microscilla sp. TaxID=432653 RepID=UPI002607F223|nr:RiPP maturation radical SAM C-methyltransferase [uncultured Microscilla sp.]